MVSLKQVLKTTYYYHIDCFTETPRGGVQHCIWKNQSVSYLPRPDLKIYKKGILVYYIKTHFINHEKRDCPVMGDFNINLLKTNSNTHIEDFLQSNLSLDLKTCISKPTRITSTSKSFIDNIFSLDILRQGI